MKCIIPGCSSTEQSKTLFSFPENDCELFEKWKNAIQMVDLKIINVNKNFICEDHFENIDIKINPGNTKILAPNAVPSIFSCNENITMDSCRFCLKKLHQSNEKMKINEEVRKNFEELMNFKLKINKKLPNFTCDKCFNELQSSVSTKRRIARIQKKLDELIEDSNPTPIEKLAHNNRFKNLQLVKVKCPTCKNYVKKCDLGKHIEDLHSEPKAKPKPDEDDLQEHLPKFHGNGGIYTGNQETIEYKNCLVCSDRFLTEIQLEQHVINDHPNCRYCSPCNIIFIDLTEIENHLRNEHCCHICNEFYHTVETLQRHLENRHKIFQEKVGNSKVICSSCGLEIPRNLLKRHKLMCGVKYHCDFCGEQKNIKSEMEHHLKKEHLKYPATVDISVQESDRKFTCNQCNKSFGSAAAMRKHVKIIHLGIVEICEICGMEFKNLTTCQEHIRTKHIYEKPYKCSECDEAFSSARILYVHKDTAHSSDSLFCQFCSKKFLSRIYLLSHIRYNHRKKSFQCSYENCTKAYSSKGLLNYHIKSIHLKGFSCKSCDKRFGTATVLKRHVESQHKNNK